MSVTRATLRRHYREQYLRFQRAQENLTQIINSVLEDFGPSQNIRPTPLVEHSVKEFVSFWEKAQEFERKGRVSCADDCFVEIHDLARARVICQTIGDAERIRRLMEERDNILFTNAKVQVHAPGPGVVSSGYRAIHLDLEIDAPFMGKQVATPCELQVVTALQYAWGLYTHKDFYKSANVPPLVGDLMSELSNLLNVADQVAGHLIREVESRAA